METWFAPAKLNLFLHITGRRADVREAVIQTILHVARQFPIIRFDAAMTLAKKHYQRLWFPARRLRPRGYCDTRPALRLHPGSEAKFLR